MNYTVRILRRAQKELEALPRSDYDRVRNAIAELATDPRPNGCKKLIDRDGWRIRVGDYRVIYEIDDPAKIVTVLHIGHRSDIY